MKDRKSKPDRSNMTNLRPATCEHCGADLKPGSGFVWICLGPKGECEDPVHIERGGGAHIRCKDQGACHGRATKAMGRRSKRAAVASAAATVREDAQQTPEIATETDEEVEDRTLTPGNSPETFPGPSQRSEVMEAGPPHGTYVGAPLRRDCPRGHAGTVMSAGLVREFTLVGVDWYVCDGCGEGIWVWRCCGHVALEAPNPSMTYRDPAFAWCTACGENRFEARREPLKEKTWTS